MPELKDLGKTRFGLPLLWLAALLVLLIAGVVFVSGLGAGGGQLARQAQTVAQAQLAPLIRQRSIPHALKSQVRQLLQRQETGFNYITLRNANHVILVSSGRYEHMASWLGATRARQLRGALYRLSSRDRQIALHHNGKVVGYMDYGISWAAIAGQAGMLVWLALVVSLLALFVLAWLTIPAWEALRLQADGAPPHKRSWRDLAAKMRPAAKQHAPVVDQSDPLAMLATLADSAGIGLLTASRSGQLRLSNNAAEQLLGQAAETLQGQTAEAVLKTFDAQGRALSSPLQKCLYGGRKTCREQARLRRDDGSEIEVDLAAATLGDVFADAAVVFFRDTAGDAVAVGQPDKLAALSSALLERTDEGQLMVDASGSIVHASRPCQTLLGYNPGALQGRHVAELLPQAFADGLPVPCAWSAVEAVDATGSPTSVDMLCIALQGAQHPGHAVILRQPLADGLASRDDGGSADRSARLLGRDLLAERIGQVCVDDQSGQWLLMLVDWAQFKRVNHDFGWAVGDGVLAAFGHALEQLPLESDCVVRLGGDEFALLVKLEQPGEDSAQAKARQLQLAFSQPLQYADLEFTPCLAVGMVAVSGGEDDVDALLQCAQAALYTGKEVGDGTACFYTESMQPDAAGRSSAATQLRRALAADAITIGLQPVAAGDARAPLAAARLRLEWAVADKTLSGCDLFAYAQEHGLLAEMANWLLRSLGKTWADWRDIGLAPVSFLLPATPALAALPQLGVNWQSLIDRYELADNALILHMSPAGWSASGLERAPLGMRLALGCSLDAPPQALADVLYLDSALADVNASRDFQITARALTAFSHKHNRPLVIGPVTQPGQLQTLPTADGIYCYGDLQGETCTARAFGRALARRGAAAL